MLPLSYRKTVHDQGEIFNAGIFAITTRGCVAYEAYDSGGITAQCLLDFLRQHYATKQHEQAMKQPVFTSHQKS